MALKGVLYGGKQRIDVERLQRLAAGFQQFTVDGLAVEPALSAANVRLVQRHIPVIYVIQSTASRVHTLSLHVNPQSLKSSELSELRSGPTAK